VCVVCVSAVTVASLIAPAPIPVVESNITGYTITNKACPKSKLNKVENNKICLKDGRVYRWAVKNKKSLPTPETSQIPMPSPSINTSSQNKPEYIEKISFNSLCDYDPLVPLELKPYSDAAKKINCYPPYRFVSYKINEKPKSYFSDLGNSMSECNINPENFTRRTALWHPNYKVRVVSFQTIDLKSDGNPQKEWKDFFDYALSTFDNLTDVKSNYIFDFDNKYFNVPIFLKNYNLSGKYGHGDQRQEVISLAQTIINNVDKDINFSGYDAIYFLPPKNVSKELLSNFIVTGPIKTAEKTFWNGAYIGSRFDEFDSPYFNPRDPFGFIHEFLIHVSNTIDDSYGDLDGDKGVGHFGTGRWGNGSGAISDFLGFDKLQLGLIGKHQALCLTKNKESQVWLRPLSSDGEYIKIAMIKISDNEAIVIQSMRAYGYNYKLPKNQHGLLVVHVDTKKMYEGPIYGDGQYVACPNRNSAIKFHGGCSSKELYDATLKLNESLTFKGYKITVIESGNFGDVVKIEKQ
jgi:hypothetical protein